MFLMVVCAQAFGDCFVRRSSLQIVSYKLDYLDCRHKRPLSNQKILTPVISDYFPSSCQQVLAVPVVCLVVVSL